MKKRNLAFYKRGGAKWELQDFQTILDHTGAIPKYNGFSKEKATKKFVEDMKSPYIFDNAVESDNFMHAWASQDYKHCTLHCFEDYFHPPKLKTYKIGV